MNDFLNFTHFSNGSYDAGLSINQKSDVRPWKPSGFWFAPCNDWITWCNESGFFPNVYDHQYGIESIDMNKIVQINTIKDIEDFIKKYGGVSSWGTKYIDWHQVAKDYAGIFFNFKELYAKSFNVKYSPLDILFASLDVDSLVVWDQSILQLKLLKYSKSGFYSNQNSDDD